MRGPECPAAFLLIVWIEWTGVPGTLGVPAKMEASLGGWRVSDAEAMVVDRRGLGYRNLCAKFKEDDLTREFQGYNDGALCCSLTVVGESHKEKGENKRIRKPFLSKSNTVPQRISDSDDLQILLGNKAVWSGYPHISTSLGCIFDLMLSLLGLNTKTSYLTSREILRIDRFVHITTAMLRRLSSDP